MKDNVNKRLCELLGCDVPRPKDICPTCGKTNTDGKMRFIDGADFFSEKGRIDLLKRLKEKGCVYEFLARYNFAADFSRDLLNDTGALARAALDFLEVQAITKYAATELNAYMTLHEDDKTIDLSDGVGYIDTLTAGEVLELYLVLKNIFERKEKKQDE